MRHSRGAPEAGWGSIWKLVPTSCLGFPSGSDGKASACKAGVLGAVGKIPWRRSWQPILVLLPGESHGQRSLAGYSPWGCKGSDTTEPLTLSCLGVGSVLTPATRSQEPRNPRSTAAAAPASVPRATQSVWPQPRKVVAKIVCEITGFSQHKAGVIDFL